MSKSAGMNWLGIDHVHFWALLGSSSLGHWRLFFGSTPCFFHGLFVSQNLSIPKSGLFQVQVVPSCR